MQGYSKTMGGFVKLGLINPDPSPLLNSTTPLLTWVSFSDFCLLFSVWLTISLFLDLSVLYNGNLVCLCYIMVWEEHRIFLKMLLFSVNNSFNILKTKEWKRWRGWLMVDSDYHGVLLIFPDSRELLCCCFSSVSCQSLSQNGQGVVFICRDGFCPLSFLGLTYTSFMCKNCYSFQPF